MTEVRIIESIEQSTMASTWTEHLCLHETASGRWCIDIRGYEVVGESNEFEDEEGELPDEIDGYAVVGTEDGYVVIHNLVLHSEDYPVYKFSEFDIAEFQDLFGAENAEWCSAETINKIKKLTDMS